MKKRPIYRRVEQWEIYDRIAGNGVYSDIDKKFVPSERYDWTLLTEIALFRNAVKGCKKVLDNWLWNGSSVAVYYERCRINYWSG